MRDASTFVAVFFALSAFLLWRRRGLHTLSGYGRSRVARLLPAYYACVVAVMLLLPDAHSLTLTQLLSNLTSTQIYVVDGLYRGLPTCGRYAWSSSSTLPCLCWGGSSVRCRGAGG